MSGKVKISKNIGHENNKKSQFDSDVSVFLVSL